MRCFLLLLVLALPAGASPLDDFLAAARAKHGEPGAAAARFLIDHMPDRDRATLSAEFLIENLDLAFRARAEFPWAASVPTELFHNDVLPYAVFDETREPWRPMLLEKARVLVKDASSAAEAAQALNRGLFKELNVHYHTGRKRPNQSPGESIALNKATCTGLAIILVDACRAVGIPARGVGTPMWTNERGNHTWVEIWDRDWHFTGADEYDPQGLNRGWFVGDAAKAKADEPRYAIYATSWKREGVSFPVVWSRHSTNVAAVNVTARYARPEAIAAVGAERSMLGLRLFDRTGGSRLVAHVCAVQPSGEPLAEAVTKAGTADLNDLARLDLAPGTEGRLRFTVNGESRELPFGPLAKGEPTLNAVWSELKPVSTPLSALEAWLALPPAEQRSDAPALQAALTRDQAARATELLLQRRLARISTERRAAFEGKSLTLGSHTLRWLDRTFGEAPADGRSLWISMHGGGNAPSAVNDRQWTNQARLYEPAEGLYIAPRAPTDTWNLWHEAHVDPLLQQLIDTHVALAGVNPDKVYLMGYSAGGDGVWQLAPRLADRFAAAAMMAGHPNEASLLGLRNLPFAAFVGGNDTAYRRNLIVAERAAELDRLALEDPGAYLHLARVYEGVGHWMNKRDAEALPWMATYRRNPWPKKVVWAQDDVVHRRFYWLQVPAEVAIPERAIVTATVEGNTVTVTGQVPPGLQLRLSDALLDLDQPVQVRTKDREVFSGKVQRQAANLVISLEERADAASAASA
ncbi:MAG: polyhydroxyalkanoate depolymerase, partial [Verrucomicrobiales bacterium]|nr:polyhydroxyalkanoate depolymerase [Verrucomicrobiales bacterium]